MVARHRGLGLWLALASAAAFGTSGPFAKALLVEGWTSGAIVLLRVAGATVVLAVPTALALREELNGALAQLQPYTGKDKPVMRPAARSPTSWRCSAWTWALPCSWSTSASSSSCSTSGPAPAWHRHG